jgi:hypothetical protein
VARFAPQENLFETAVGGDDVIRNHLASYLRPSSKNNASDKADTAGLEAVNIGSWTLRGRTGATMLRPDVANKRIEN